MRGTSVYGIRSIDPRGDSVARGPSSCRTAYFTCHITPAELTLSLTRTRRATKCTLHVAWTPDGHAYGAYHPRWWLVELSASSLRETRILLSGESDDGAEAEDAHRQREGDEEYHVTGKRSQVVGKSIVFEFRMQVIRWRSLLRRERKKKRKRYTCKDLSSLKDVLPSEEEDMAHMDSGWSR